MRVLNKIKPARRFGFDIETAAGFKTFAEMPERLRTAFVKKFEKQIMESESWAAGDENQVLNAIYRQKGGLSPTFGRVVALSLAYKKGGKIEVKSYAGTDELKILQDFAADLNKFSKAGTKFVLCGHNIKIFDVPFIIKRMLIHGIRPPQILDMFGRKPWENGGLVDTLELWKAGDFTAGISFDTLCCLMGIESPKSDINGADVGNCYYNGEVDRIAKYCDRDVVANLQLIEKLITFS